VHKDFGCKCFQKQICIRPHGFDAAFSIKPSKYFAGSYQKLCGRSSPKVAVWEFSSKAEATSSVKRMLAFAPCQIEIGVWIYQNISDNPRIAYAISRISLTADFRTRFF
jgi:hypothetical protein